MKKNLDLIFMKQIEPDYKKIVEETAAILLQALPEKEARKWAGMLTYLDELPNLAKKIVKDMKRLRGIR